MYAAVDVAGGRGRWRLRGAAVEDAGIVDAAVEDAGVVADAGVDDEPLTGEPFGRCRITPDCRVGFCTDGRCLPPVQFDSASILVNVWATASTCGSGRRRWIPSSIAASGGPPASRGVAVPCRRGPAAPSTVSGFCPVAPVTSASTVVASSTMSVVHSMRPRSPSPTGPRFNSTDPTGFGYHVIKVDEKTAGRQRTFDEVKSSILHQLKEQQQARATRELLDELMSGAED